MHYVEIPKMLIIKNSAVNRAFFAHSALKTLKVLYF